MKGFKPTGYGPSSGFVFSAKHGFTGSTGAYTKVQPYVRRKAFADGGFVRQDNPRMKADMTGDQGSALVRRARSTTDLDEVSGGKSPLRPGFKKGGALKMAAGMKMPMKKGMKKPMKKAGGGRAKALGAMSGAPSDKDRKYLQDQMAGFAAVEGRRADAQGHGPRRAPAMGAIKEKFYEDGGKVVRGTSSKGLWASVKDIPELISQLPALAKDAGQRSMARAQKDVADTKRRRIDSIVDNNGNSRFARGGKVCKADGGRPDGYIRTFMPANKGASRAEKVVRASEVDSYGKRQRSAVENNLAEYKRATDPGMKSLIQKATDVGFGVPNHTPNLSKTRDFKPKLREYASGGETRMTKC